jgi:uncharacterized protein
MAALAAFAATGLFLAVATSLLDRSWIPARPADPLRPTSLPNRPALPTGPIALTDLLATGADSGIAGHLVSPTGGADTAVVLVAGAGRSSRQQLLDPAKELAQRGLHAVTYDKATKGYSWRTRNFSALAADLQAVIEQTRRVTAARRVGVIAFSEGSWVATRALAQPGRPDFLVLASAPIVSPLEQAIWSVDTRLAGMPTAVRRVAAYGLAGGRAFLDYLDEDPPPHLRACRLPVLGIWGAEDRIVPVPTAVRQLIEHAPQPVTVTVLPGTGHDLDGHPGWLDHVARWVLTERPPPTDEITGVEPALTLDVPGVPRGAWFTQPAGHLAASALVAAAVLIGTRRRPKP